MKLNGKKILITGGGSGIGKALALKLVSEGAKIIICGRTYSKLEEVKAMSESIDIFECDISDDDERQALYKYIIDNHSDLSMIVNNAGIQLYYDYSEEVPYTREVLKEIDINLIAPIEMCHLFLPLIKKNPSPSIVNVSSVMGYAPKKSSPIYCATKGAIQAYTKSLRYQLEHEAVEVYEIIPPLVDTQMTAGRTVNKTSPEEIAQNVVNSIKRRRYTIQIGKATIILTLNRFFPKIVERILKNA